MSYRPPFIKPLVPAWLVALLVPALPVGVVVALVWLTNALSAASCSSQAEKMRLEHDYGFFQGCMVKTRRGWVPMTAIREIDP